jgi:hypothetical protein
MTASGGLAAPPPGTALLIHAATGEELYPHDNDRATPHGIVRQGDLKLIEYFEDGRLELYDLKTDVGEKANLADSRPDKARDLPQLLIEWRKQVGAQMPLPKPSPK